MLYRQLEDWREKWAGCSHRPERPIAASPGPLGDEGDAFFLHFITKAAEPSEWTINGN